MYFDFAARIRRWKEDILNLSSGVGCVEPLIHCSGLENCRRPSLTWIAEVKPLVLGM